MPATGKTTSSPAIRCYRVSKCISGTDLRHPEASPIWREDFAGLPPVHILTAEFDPLRDEGEALYHRLNDQGVACTCQRYLGVIHGFFQLGGVSQAARSAMRDVAWRVVSPSTGKMT